MKKKFSLSEIMVSIGCILLAILSLYFFITKSYRGIFWCISSLTLHICSFAILFALWSGSDQYPFPKRKKSLKQKFHEVLIMLIGIIYFAFIFIVTAEYENSQLMKYGERQTSKVTSSFTKYLSRGGGWRGFVEIEYSFNDKTYHQNFRDYDTIYKIGDNVNILISTKDPMLFEVLE